MEIEKSVENSCKFEILLQNTLGGGLFHYLPWLRACYIVVFKKLIRFGAPIRFGHFILLFKFQK